MQMYDDAAYARSRLVETVVMCRGLPVVVDDIRAKTAALRILNTNEQLIVKADELDITPVKLGYINESNRALYLTRTPMREDWRQGLRARSIRVVGYDSKIYEPAPASLYDTILGIYPKLEYCFSVVKANVADSFAFSRNFALKNEGKLLYKGKWEVGHIEENKQYELFPKFDWVREMLDEELVAA